MQYTGIVNPTSENEYEEWQVSVAIDEDDDFAWIDIDLTVGHRWGSHQTISIGSAHTHMHEDRSDMIPDLEQAIDEVDDIISALQKAKAEIQSKVAEYRS